MRHLTIAAAALGAIASALAMASPAAATHTAGFECSPSCAISAGQSITFSAETTAKPDQVLPPYEWDLDGDKTTTPERAGYETHTGGPTTAPTPYPVPGTYTIRLRINADQGGGAHYELAEREITVTEAPPPPPGPTLAPLFTPSASAAGALTYLDASTSTVPSGREIVSYLWDFNGDRHIDANTGSIPFAAHRFDEPGVHSVGLQLQDSSGAFSDMFQQQIQTSAVQEPNCRSTISLGFLEISASCIRREGQRFIVELTTGASIDGVEIVSGPGAELVLDTSGSRWSLSATGRIKAQLTNTPVGTITIFERDLRANPITFGAGADSEDPGAPGLLLGSFAVSHECEPSGPTEVCATLPGGFPLTGSVSLYLTAPDDASSPPGMLVAANAELSRPFPVTGDVDIAANLDTGPQIDSFGFEVGRIDLGIARVNRLELGYQRRDDDGDLDVWEGGVDASLLTPIEAGVAGDFRFANSRFSRASLTLRGLRIPVGPGIFLNSFGAGLGVDPFTLRGSLGVGFGPADVNGSFVYENTNPDHIGVAGNFSLLGNELASASVDYWTNGDLEFAGEFHFGYPNRSSALVLVDGRIAGWFQGSRGRFQVEGEVSAAIPILAGRIAALVNNDWIAGCGSVRARDPFSRDPYATWGFELAGHLALRLRDGALEGGFGSCDLGPYRNAGPRSAQAGGARSLRLPAGLPGAEFEISSALGLPAVTVEGPGGERFTTPATPQPPSREGRFLQVGAAHENELHVYISRPRGGRWTITPQDGTPAITGLRQSFQLPKPRVRARVTGRGRTRALVYRLRRIAGQSVRFREDGADTNRVIGSATGASGRIRFTPSEGRGRSRRIVADVTQDGRPRTTLVAGRYRAPRPFAPARPGRVRAKRRGGRVTLTWGRSRGAAGYLISVRGSDGRRKQYVTGARRRRLVLSAIPQTSRLVVTVRGESRTHRAGRARRVVVKAERQRQRPRRRSRR